MIDIIILMVGMLAFIALGATINHAAQTVYWWIYEWRLSREDARMIDTQEIEDECENVLRFQRPASAKEE